MTLRELQKIEHLHHAYLVVGGKPTDVMMLLEARGVRVLKNADVLSFTYTDMGVDDARALAQYAFLKSIDAHKYFVVSFEKVNDAAQNALLKVVEEAPGSTIFFFCTPAGSGLLATLRSRLVQVDMATTVADNTSDAIAFLKLGYPARLEVVEELLATAKKQDDRTPLRTFVRLLIVAAHERKLDAPTLRALQSADKYLRLTGGSPKLVLSHLALVLPRA